MYCVKTGLRIHCQFLDGGCQKRQPQYIYHWACCNTNYSDACSFVIGTLIFLSIISFLVVVISRCISMPCLNEGTCMELEDGYNCTCTDDFEGDNCETGIIFCKFLTMTRIRLAS